MRKGKGYFVSSIVAEYYTDNKSLLNKIDSNICEVRQKFYIKKEGKLSEISSEKIKIEDDITMGVELIAKKNVYFVVIDVPMPACFELQKTEDIYDYYYDYFWYPVESHDTYSSIFYWGINKGDTINFYLKVIPVLTGRFSMPPVKVFEMYNPERVSYGIKRTLIVK